MPTVKVNESVSVLLGDCLESLRTLPDGSVNTCITSPPYWGLRDYGHSSQIGIEKSPEEYVARMVEVFREVRRVLRDDGTLWLNLGDTYANNPIGKINGGGFTGVSAKTGGRDFSGVATSSSVNEWKTSGLKQKDLVGIPWRVAFALQADGWYLRQDIIWHKPNPMPESVRDRCTKAHEYIFLLSKSQKYYFDGDAISEPLATKPHAPGNKKSIGDTSHKRTDISDPEKMERVWGAKGKKNKRSVWTVTTKPYPGAHFAAFPPDLIEPCILAGSPENGLVLDPFGGSGTAAEVAIRHGRSCLLCELNPLYLQLIKERINRASGGKENLEKILS
jgi:DNA modification methylase